jgi:hypothetical protein
MAAAGVPLVVRHRDAWVVMLSGALVVFVAASMGTRAF